MSAADWRIVRYKIGIKLAIFVPLVAIASACLAFDRQYQSATRMAVVLGGVVVGTVLGELTFAWFHRTPARSGSRPGDGSSDASDTEVGGRPTPR